MQGVIKTVRIDKGFGFIACDGEDRASHFFHWSELRDLRLGEELIGCQVEFDSSVESRGLRATNIRPVKE